MMVEQIKQLAKQGKTFRISFPYEGAIEVLKKSFGEAEQVQAHVWRFEDGVLVLCGKEAIWFKGGEL